MAIRKVGGEAGNPLVVACNVATTHQDAVGVGGIVTFSTSSNWCVNSAASDAHINNCGRVLALNDTSSVATVEFFGYNKVWEATISTACGLGSTVVVADTSLKLDYVNSSGGATSSLKLCRCVATAFPTTGKCQWVSV